MTPRLTTPETNARWSARTGWCWLIILFSGCSASSQRLENPDPNQLPHMSSMLARSPTASLGVATSTSTGPASLWSLLQGRFIGWLQTPRTSAGVVFSQDERFVALTLNGQVDPRRRPVVSVFRTDTSELVFSTRVDRLRTRRDLSRVSEEGRQYFIEPRIVFSQTGDVALIGPFGELRDCRYPFEIRGTNRWRRLGTICLGADNDAIALSPDGRFVATGAASRTHIFDLRRPNEPIRIPGIESVLSLLFSPDGEWLAAETWEGLKIAHVPTRSVATDVCNLMTRSTRSSPGDIDLVATPYLDHFVIRPPMAFSSSGELFAAASEHICLFDLSGSEPRFVRRELAFPAQAMRFGADDRELAVVERFVDGYILEILQLDAPTARYSDRAAFLHPGRPSYEADRGWRACGMTCPFGLYLRCNPIDNGPLMTDRCDLECRGDSASRPEPRCLSPSTSSIIPALERLLDHESSVIRRRAEEHIDRLVNEQ